MDTIEKKVDDSLASSNQAQQHWDSNYMGDHASQENLSRIYTLGSPLFWN